MADTRQKLGALTKRVDTFEAMANLPGFAEKQRALLRKVDEVFAVAKVGRNYVDKHGAEHSQPDASAMGKCVDIGARILGVLAEAEKRVKAGDQEQQAVDIEQIAGLLRSVGYRVEKAEQLQ